MYAFASRAVLGDDVARSVGARVGRARLVAAAIVAVLCGAGTAAVGPISFVGLVVPHVGRRVTGPDHRWLTLPFAHRHTQLALKTS